VVWAQLHRRQPLWLYTNRSACHRGQRTRYCGRCGYQ
jgi:hypothetical protein